MERLKEKLPPANALIVFEAAARHVNFSRASEELSIVQPAVTRQIRNLEASLKVSLFVRNNNKLSLTPEGEQLYQVVQEGLEKIAAVSELLRGSSVESLLIGSTFAFATLWVAERLSALRRALPGAHLNLLISEHYEDFNTGPADCSIRFGNGNWDGMHARLLFLENVYPIISKDLLNRISRDGKPDWSQVSLLDQPHDARNLDWATWESWQEQSKVNDFATCGRQTFENYLYVLDSVRRGEGVALGMAGLTSQYEKNHGLVKVGPSVARKNTGYYLVYPEWYPREQTIATIMSVFKNR